MKTYKQRILQVKQAQDHQELLAALWNYISFPLRLPNRPHQKELLEQAVPFSMQAPDPYFTRKELAFNGFIWGSGRKKVYFTHGWSSKAADFTEIITALNKLDDLQIIAFDALGNGSSEGELSNLMLYVKPLEAIINSYGMPDVLIGHSLGAMANIVALKEFKAQPELMISITPVVQLEQNFKGMMSYAGVSAENQAHWLDSFHEYYKLPVSYFDVKSLYALPKSTKHIVYYDQNDEVLPYGQLAAFLKEQPQIIVEELKDAGHHRILKEQALINAIRHAVENI